MGWRGTLVLVVLVAVVGGYLWLSEAPAPEPRGDAPTLLGEPRLSDPSDFVALLPFQTAEVVSVHVLRGQSEFTAKREADTWTSSMPAAAIDVFLRGLSELGRVMEIPATDDVLRDYGLDEPTAVVRLGLRDREQPLTLTAGQPNPATTGVYVRVNNSGPVILAGALLTWELDKLFHPVAD